MSSLPASARITAARSRPLAYAGLLRALLAVATAIVLLASALLLLFTPAWVHLAISLSGGAAWLDSPAVAHQLSDRTIAELLFGPATFAFSGADGRPFFSADEAAHLRDVRLVLYAFLGLAPVAASVLGWALVRHRAVPAVWVGIARGGAMLAVSLLVLGAVAVLAFGAAFEVFHRLLFPGGNWAFPADSNLVRLYPLGFWQLSAAALGTLGIAAGGLTWLLATRRARSLEDGQR